MIKQFHIPTPEHIFRETIIRKDICTPVFIAAVFTIAKTCQQLKCPSTEERIRKISIQFSCSVMSDSLRPHGLQHSRLPCPSPTPGAYSNSCPSSWWCHPTISWSVVPFSSCLQSFPPSGTFAMTQFFPAAAAAAKSLQSCLTLCDPIDSSPPGSAVPGILQARTLEWVAISFSNAWKWSRSVVSYSSLSQGTAAYQTPPSLAFSRQEYWSGLPLPSPH